MDIESNDIENQDTLQSDVNNTANDSGDDNNAELEQQQAVESATTSEPEHEENTEGGAGRQVNQDAINEAIAKQHAKYREEQRKRQQLEQQLQQYQQQNNQVNDPEPSIVNVDPYSDDIEDQIKQRDESIRAHIAWQNRQQQRELQQRQHQQQTLAQQQQESAQAAEQYFARAKQDGLDQQQFAQAIQTVGQYQLGHDIANYLMHDDKGHQVTMHLSKNPALLAELSMMHPTQAILHIERNVRSKLNAQPRRSKSNPPATRVKGRAADVSDQYPLTGGKVRIE